MSSYIVDIETDGLLPDLTKIHCIVMRDVDTKEVESFTDASSDYLSIDTGLACMMLADKIILHNGINFDIPAIKKVYPHWSISERKVIDTLVLSRLIFSNIKDWDYRAYHKRIFPNQYIGHQSLKAWGHRLKLYKGTYGEDKDNPDLWKNWSQEMHDYCIQDTLVTDALYQKLIEIDYSKDAIDIEHRIAWYLSQQERNGFPFNTTKAVRLYAELKSKQRAVNKKLKQAFGKWYAPKKLFIPKRDNRKMHYTKGCEMMQLKLIEFNPSSRNHIANRLQRLYGWKPTEFTGNGEPKLDESVLKNLDFPEAPLLIESLTLNKRIGQLAEGKQGWLKLEQGGFIYGSINPNGCVTGRCTHSKPNVGQVPAAKDNVLYGKEFRSLFTVPTDYNDPWVLLGSDASGLELRCLGHYMFSYDGGAYIRELLNGDIHTANQHAAELDNRDIAKRFIYAFLYGAGDAKIGEIVIPKLDEAAVKMLLKFGIWETEEECFDKPLEESQKHLGAKLKDKFLKNTPALKRLREDVMKVAKERGWLRALDGRKVYVRSLHSALNTLFQSAGAIICKKWCCEIDKTFRDKFGWKPGWNKDCQYAQVAFVHDETQTVVRQRLADKAGETMVKLIRTNVRDHFNFNCPLDAEYKIGMDWSETH